jgi:hypothetical protein
MEFKLTIGVTPELQTTLEKIANALSLVPAQVHRQTVKRSQTDLIKKLIPK